MKTYVISRSILFMMRNMADEIFRENQNPHFTFNCFFFFFFENHVVNGKMRKDMIQADRLQMTT